MKFEHLGNVESFQQKVLYGRVQDTAASGPAGTSGSSDREGTTGTSDIFAYAKYIISDYSWWTFDDTDVFQRETLSYRLLNGIGVGPRLLHTDEAQRMLIVEEAPRAMPVGDEVQPLLQRLVELLQRLRELSGNGLTPCPAEHLAQMWHDKGQAAGVEVQLLDEVAHTLETWHARYGAEVCYNHGDLHLGNVICNGREIAGVIDFEEAVASLPIFDATTLAGSIHGALGEEAYAYFRQAYEQAFGLALIDRQERQRFYHLRGWIAGCYLQQCCPPALQQAARAFIFPDAPTIRTR